MMLLYDYDSLIVHDSIVINHEYINGISIGYFCCSCSLIAVEGMIK